MLGGVGYERRVRYDQFRFRRYSGLALSGGGALVSEGVNAYTGTTSIIAGNFQAGGREREPSSAVVMGIGSGAALTLNNFPETIASLSGGGSINLGSSTLIVGNSSSTTYSGIISGMA